MSKKMLLLLILITSSILIGMEKQEAKKVDKPSPIKEEPKRKLSASKTTEKSSKHPYTLLAEKIQSISTQAHYGGYLD